MKEINPLIGKMHLKEIGHPMVDPISAMRIKKGKIVTAEEAVPAPEGTTEVIETDYEIGQDNISHAITIEFDVHKPVFLFSSLAIIASCA